LTDPQQRVPDHGRVVTMLIVMSGLPGVGKSSTADTLGRRLAVPVLSVDPVEAAM
jgi:predicted kinase